MTLSPAANAWFWGMIAAIIVLGRFVPFLNRRWTALRMLQIAVWAGLVALFAVHEFTHSPGARIVILTIVFLSAIGGNFIWWIWRSSSAPEQAAGKQ